ncbi:hypothetical protein NX059_008945 [Plenodomus lindquistii]|nr:hypothetical protein NX059_008945 [Plenodomus lindquistii]
MVTIKVGPAAHEYRAHKVLLMHYSGYFRGALGSTNFEEGRTGVITLEDVDTYAFVVFLKWLYSEDFPDWEARDFENWGNPDESTDKAIVMVYIFADRFLVRELAEHASEMLYEEIGDNDPCTDAIIAAFAGLRSDSPVLRMLIDLCCLHWSPGSCEPIEAVLEELPLEYYRHLAYRFAAMRDEGFKGHPYSEYEEPDIGT